MDADILIRKGFFLAGIIIVLIIILPIVSAENNTWSENQTTGLQLSTESTAAPFITIDPIEDHTVGAVFYINGTTNLPTSEKLNGLIQTTIFKPHIDAEPPSPFFPDIPIVSTSSGTNRWSVNITDRAISELGIGGSPYVVTVVSKDNSSISTQQEFDLIPAMKAAPSTVPQTIIESPSTVQPTTSQTLVPPTTRSSSLPSALAIVVLAAIAILGSVFRKKRD